MKSHLEKSIQENGFKSLTELADMVASLDLTRHLDAFNEWKEKDGSKTGLEVLVNKFNHPNFTI